MAWSAGTHFYFVVYFLGLQSCTVPFWKDQKTGKRGRDRSPTETRSGNFVQKKRRGEKGKKWIDMRRESERDVNSAPFSHRVSFREEIAFLLSVNQVVRKTNSLASQKDIFLRHLNRRTFIYFRGPTNQKIEDTLRFSSKSWMAAWSNDCCSWHGGKKKQKRRRYRLGIRKNDFGHVTDFGERGETRKQK